MKTTLEKITNNFLEGRILHPAIDQKEDIFIFGFRILTKDLKEENIFVVSDGKKIEVFDTERFEFNGKEYLVEIQRGEEKRLLPRLEERWEIKNLFKFIEDFNAAKIGEPSLREIYEKIESTTRKYLELEDALDYKLLAIWSILTYFFPIFSSFPFLHIKGPKQSGKTQTLKLLERICFNAVKDIPTLAAFCDTVDSLRGTYLIDQAEALKRKGNEELVRILTDSYKRGGGKRRLRVSAGGKKWKTIELETYSPKVFAATGDLPEDLQDRCVVIPLIRSQKVFEEPSEEDQEFQEIRALLYKCAFTQFLFLKNHYEFLKFQYRQNNSITGRELELWLPFETFLKAIGINEMETEKIKSRFRQLYGFTQYEPSDLEKAVIRVIATSFPEEKEGISLTPCEIREKIEEDLWDEKFLTNHRKEIKIGKIVGKFNLFSEKKRTSQGVVYVFKREKVEKIKRIYLKDEIDTSHTALLENEVGNLTEEIFQKNEE